MAVKEFEFGPKNYFEEDYMSGDYTAPGIVRSLLECDIDQVKGGIVLTGEYYEGEYIDGTYFHDNSIKANFSCSATKVFDAEIGITDYFEEDYFEGGNYAENRGSEFALTAQAGVLQDAQADFGALFTPSMTAEAIKNSFSLMDAVFTPTVEVNANFVSEVTLNNIINQSLMADRVRVFDSSLAISATTDLTSQTIFRNADASLTSSFTAGTSNTNTINTNFTGDAGTTITVSATISCQGTLVEEADAVLSSSFSQTAIGMKYQLRDRSGVDIYESYSSVDVGPTITSTKKFGSGAFFYDTTSNQSKWDNSGYKGSIPVYYINGEYVTVLDKKVLTSSDLSSWTESSTDLPLASNDYYLFGKGVTFKYETDSNNNSHYILNTYHPSGTQDGYTGYSSTNLTNWTEHSAGFQFPGTTQKVFFTNISRDETFTSPFVSSNSTIMSIYRGTTFSGTKYLVSNISADTDSGNWCGPFVYYTDTANTDVYVAVNLVNEIWIMKGTSFSSWSNVAQLDYDATYEVKDYWHDGTYHWLVTAKNILRSSNGSSWTEQYSRSDGIQGAYKDSSGNWLIANKGNYQTTFSYGSNLNSLTTHTQQGMIGNSHTNYGNQIQHDGSKFFYTNVVNDIVGVTYDNSSFERFETTYNLPKLIIEDGGDNLTNVKTIDFWFRQSNNQSTIMTSRGSGGNLTLYKQNDLNGLARYSLFYPTSTGGFENSGTLQADNSSSTWTHHRIVQDSGRLSFYVNGSRIFTSTNTFDTTHKNLVFGHDSVHGDQGFIDELYVSDVAENDPTDTTITIPTTTWSPDENTRFLLHFDGDTTQDTSLTFDIDEEYTAQASLTATANTVLDGIAIHLGTFTASITASSVAGNTINADSSFDLNAEGISVVTVSPATLSTQVTATIDGSKLALADATINSEASVTADGNRLRFVDTNFDSIATTINVINKIGNTLVDFPDGEFTITTNADKLFGIIETFTSQASISADALHIKNFEIDTLETTATITADVNVRPAIFMDNEGTGTLEADVNVIRDIDDVLTASFDIDPFISGTRDFVSNPDVEFTQQTNAIITAVGEADLDATVSTDIDAVKTARVETTLTTTATATIEATKIVDVDTEFDSIATSASAVAKIGDFLINLESAFSTNVEVTKTTGNVIVAESTVTITAEPLHIKNVAIDEATAAFTQSTNGRKGTDVAGTFDIEASTQATVAKVVVAEATISGALSFGISIRITRNNEIDLTDDFNLTATGDRTRGHSATISSESTVAGEVNRIRQGAASITATTSVTADGKVIVIDAIVFKIAKETREFSITGETREYQVQFEQRETILK